MEYKDLITIGGKEWHLNAIMNNEVSEMLQSQFRQEMYNYYVNIRMCVGGNKCNKMRFAEVKQELEKEYQRYTVEQTLHLDDYTIDLILHVAETKIPMVR